MLYLKIMQKYSNFFLKQNPIKSKSASTKSPENTILQYSSVMMLCLAYIFHSNQCNYKFGFIAIINVRITNLYFF